MIDMVEEIIIAANIPELTLEADGHMTLIKDQHLLQGIISDMKVNFKSSNNAFKTINAY